MSFSGTEKIGLVLIVALGAFFLSRAQAMTPAPIASPDSGGTSAGDLTSSVGGNGMTTYDPSRLTGAQQNMADLIVRRCDDSSMNAAFFLALAVTESSLNPNTLGDDGISVGLFQINKKFQPAGTTISELDNPDTNITDAFVLFNSFLASWPGQTWGDYAEAWTEGGHARFDLGRRNPAKITHMQKAIDDLVLNLDLSASVA